MSVTSLVSKYFKEISFDSKFLWNLFVLLPLRSRFFPFFFFFLFFFFLFPKNRSINLPISKSESFKTFQSTAFQSFSITSVLEIWFIRVVSDSSIVDSDTRVTTTVIFSRCWIVTAGHEPGVSYKGEGLKLVERSVISWGGTGKYELAEFLFPSFIDTHSNSIFYRENIDPC